MQPYGVQLEFSARMNICFEKKINKLTKLVGIIYLQGHTVLAYSNTGEAEAKKIP